MAHITYVKKVLADGQTCGRCIAVSEKLRSDGLFGKINHLVIADDNNTDSLGLQLVKQHAIQKVPFFVVDDDLGETHIFQDYQEFKRYIQN